MSSSTEQAAGEPATHGDAAAGAAAPGGGRETGPRRGNRLATASLIAGAAGITMVTVIPALVWGLLGLRRASRDGLRGRGAGVVRCWAGIGLSVMWAVAGLYLLPHLVRAADPGCAVYKGPALTAYNRAIADLGMTHQDGRPSGAAAPGSGSIAPDLARAITALNLATARSASAATVGNISRLTMQLQIVLADIQNGRIVPDGALTSLNRDAAGADTACGTLNV
jgi:hypothetical protein